MLEVNKIAIDYNGKPLLEYVNFQVGRNETVCLLGPSGSGKSTILRIIAGLVKPKFGSVIWNGNDLAALPPHRRSFGFMFQDYALFPHLNVFENVAFGMRVKNLEDSKVKARVDEALNIVRLDGLSSRSVVDLSGGEKQRVAFARAIATDPVLLMLDEPLASLDRALRENLLEELHELLAVTDIPVIYVTHDQEEAFSIADRILLLHDGRIEQAGPPEEVYNHPASLWAAEFFGFSNVTAGKVESLQPPSISTGLGNISIKELDPRWSKGADITVVIPPGAVDITDTGENVFSAEVLENVFLGTQYRVLAKVGICKVSFFAEGAISPGDTVQINLNPEKLLCYEGGG